MNSATAILTADSARKAPFYERLIMDTLAKMTLGGLQMRLPDGSVCRFGDPRTPVSARVEIKRDSFFKRCVLFGDIGLGEGYVDGDWTTDDITAVISWFILNIEKSPGMSGSRTRKFLLNLLGWQNRLAHLLRRNTVSTSQQNISAHYDLGNEFYRTFLDPTMTYSSALFTAPGESLEDAQIAKYDRLCRQLQLKPSDHILEIGSGWGGFACHAVRNYGVRLTTVTISKEQFSHARELFTRERLSARIDLRLEDYRNIKGRYDKIVSIEMLEAVGEEYLETFFAKCHSVLKPEGLLSLQMITCPDSRHDAMRKNVDWIQKHIFPGSLLLSVHRVNQALRRTGDLFLHDLKDLGLSYAETLRRWRHTFNQNEAGIRALKFDDRFIRLWNYYLSYCEAAFASRNITVIQAVYTRPNNPTLAGT